MDTELAARLDRSIGTPPEDADPLAGLLHEGRRSVRRRRLAVTAAAAAAVAAIAGGTALVTGGDSGRATPPVVGSPSTTSSASAAVPSATPTAAASVATPEHWPWGRELVALNFDTGEVEIRPGATVLQRIDNPYHLDPPRGSTALEVTRQGKTFWYALAWDRSGSSMASSPAGGSFDDWVREMSTIAATEEEGATSPTGPPATDFPGQPGAGLVVFAADHGELLVPREGVLILEHREGVDVGPAFASAGDDTAAAEVRDPNGKLFYVLARRLPGEPPQYIAVPQAKGGADLEAFLDFARQRYADGSGLL